MSASGKPQLSKGKDSQKERANNETCNAAGTAKKRSISTTKRRSSTGRSTLSETPILRVNFEIRGKVQGVHFRKYTQMKATSFGLRGWCQNTNTSTVVGCMEGPRVKIEQMKQWLKSTGSPKSIITGADFKETNLSEYTMENGFQIVK